MTSPFPGMDPYLEAYWGDVHASLTVYAADAINLQLPDDLVARVHVLSNRRRLVRILPAQGDAKPVSVLAFRHPDDDSSEALEIAGVEDWQASNQTPTCFVNLFRRGVGTVGHPYWMLLFAYGEGEMMAFPLRDRLPTIRIPLRRTDPDATLDLQPLIDAAYRNGGYARTIDYRRDPIPPLDAETATWANELLTKAGRR